MKVFVEKVSCYYNPQKCVVVDQVVYISEV